MSFVAKIRGCLALRGRPNSPKPSGLEKHDQHPKAEDPLRDITGWRWVIASSAMLFSIFLYAFDETIMTIIQNADIRTR